jgi:hypothetical protein
VGGGGRGPSSPDGDKCPGKNHLLGLPLVKFRMVGGGGGRGGGGPSNMYVVDLNILGCVRCSS